LICYNLPTVVASWIVCPAFCAYYLLSAIIGVGYYTANPLLQGGET